MDQTTLHDVVELIYVIENSTDPDNQIDELNNLLADEAGYRFEKGEYTGGDDEDRYCSFYDPDGNLLDREWQGNFASLVGGVIGFALSGGLLWYAGNYMDKYRDLEDGREDRE